MLPTYICKSKIEDDPHKKRSEVIEDVIVRARTWKLERSLQQLRRGWKRKEGNVGKKDSFTTMDWRNNFSYLKRFR